jgi:basic membrane protein A
MMKPVKSVFILLAIAVWGILACTQSSDCFREDIFCAGLVTDVLGIDDHGMNQNTWAGLQEAKSNGGVDRVEYIESIDTRDYEKNIAYFAENGYDVIITTGVGLRDETLRSADLYPDPVFVGMNQPHEEVRPNIIPVTFAEDQIGFAAGTLAARISKTRIVGAVCETSGIDSIWRYCEGFRAGAIYEDEDVRVQVIYREYGDSESLFIDETWGYDTAQELIHRGTDVIFAAGGATGQGALQAAADPSASLRAGLQMYAIGTERDQAAVLEETSSSVVTSIYGDASYEVQNVMRLIRDGKAHEPGPGQIAYVPFNEKYPESLTRDMDALLLALQNGEIKTNVPFEKP